MAKTPDQRPTNAKRATTGPAPRRPQPPTTAVPKLRNTAALLEQETAVSSETGHYRPPSRGADAPPPSPEDAGSHRGMLHPLHAQQLYATQHRYNTGRPGAVPPTGVATPTQLDPLAAHRRHQQMQDARRQETERSQKSKQSR